MKLKLIERKPEVEGVESFFFEPKETLTWQAGQYLHYVLHHEPTDDRGSDRWFTISSAPSENLIRLTTRFNNEKSSSFKTKLRNLQIGKSIEIAYLEGDFTIEDPNKSFVFIAGGIGITPFRSILIELSNSKKPINVTLLYSSRDQNIIFKEELEEIAKDHHNFKIHYIFSPEHIDEAKIRQLVSDLEKPIFYISGPEPMVDALTGALKEIGIAEDHIKGDWFPGYPLE